jgi:hypothetical protein
MDSPRYSPKEYFALATSLLAGIVVAAALSPKDTYFTINFLAFWGPQAIVLVILLGLKSRPAFAAGAGLVLALFLALYGAWIIRPGGNEMNWLGYLLSTPGAGIGAVVGDQIIRVRQPKQTAIVFGIGGLSAFVGLMINQGLVCITIMSCGR